MNDEAASDHIYTMFTIAVSLRRNVMVLLVDVRNHLRHHLGIQIFEVACFKTRRHCLGTFSMLRLRSYRPTHQQIQQTYLSKYINIY
jgi:hypothetical protein